MTEDEAIEAACTDVAVQLEDALRTICGSDRGFVIMVFKSEPRLPAGDGLLLSNVEPEYLPALVSDAMGTMEPHEQPKSRH